MHDFRHFVAIPLQHLAADVYTRDLSTSVALVDIEYAPVISHCYATDGEKEIYIRNSRISSISNSVQRRFGFLFRNLTTGLKIGRVSYPNEAWNPKDKILQGGNEAQSARFWHASLTLFLPTTPYSTVKYATCLSLGCENGVSSNMPKAWCYLDDVAIPMTDVDMPTFHATAGSRQPRREVKRYRGTNQNEHFGLKISIGEEKVLGQQMFVVDIEYVKDDSSLELPVRPNGSTIPRSNEFSESIVDQGLPKFHPR